MVNNKIQEFLNDKFGNVRAITKEDEIWFVAKDIAEILLYRDATDLCKGLDDDEKDTQTLRTLGGEQNLTVINESGLYSCILSITKRNVARYELARDFKKWVTKEVLPTIRKDGMYVSGEEEAESVEELNDLVSQAMERKILRKYGIGVRNDLTSTIKNNWTIKNRFLMATYTNELVYKPIFKATASELKHKYKVKKLRDDLFTEDELMKVADIEKEVALLIDFGQEYYSIKDYINKKYA